MPFSEPSSRFKKKDRGLESVDGGVFGVQGGSKKGIGMHTKTTSFKDRERDEPDSTTRCLFFSSIIFISGSGNAARTWLTVLGSPMLYRCRSLPVSGGQLGRASLGQFGASWSVLIRASSLSLSSGPRRRGSGKGETREEKKRRKTGLK